MKKYFAALALLASFSVHAQDKNKITTVNGKDAENIAFTLKNLPTVKKDKAKVIHTYSLGLVKCVKASRNVTTDGLPTYRCDNPRLSAPYQAKLLFDSLVTAGARIDPGMSQERISLKNVECTWNAKETNADKALTCKFEDLN